ncbi:Transcriptional regulator, GntR family [Candidatus Rhodobacter oscarellae]|uniref:Transcriptional regulator, GntR family n=1 Tax=Candidatus Rhodobacter oscarellae TaxID=1675527 RepID=A0A0J9E997_9RHOB|nr:GntR family transcriptional regulator [Candidatus Rhodobacter lobularis]KMW59201.1 Transcriptional regulator, GntR family [Candidatus Rhodobacter lobularis]
MALKSIQPARRRLADEVYDELVDAIKRREIGPEDNLIQEKLAAEMNISRTPVREALMRLEQEGVLTVSNRGTFRLYQMDDDEVKELYQSRAAVEGQAARILAVRNDPSEIAMLREIVSREEGLNDHSARAYFEANRAIHRSFVELAGNRYLLEMFDMIWGKAMAFQIFATIENVDLSLSLGEHMALVDVIATGDRTEALEEFTRHIQAGFDLQMRGLHS